MEVKNEKQARKALERHVELEAKIKRLVEEAGIPELAAESAALKAAATEWAVGAEKERIEISSGHATLVKQFYDSRFIGTADDLRGDEEEVGVIPLRTLLRRQFGKAGGKEIWMRVTRRHVDRELLEEVISEGILTVDDVSPAFVEKEKKPYLRIFPNE